MMPDDGFFRSVLGGSHLFNPHLLTGEQKMQQKLRWIENKVPHNTRRRNKTATL